MNIFIPLGKVIRLTSPWTVDSTVVHVESLSQHYDRYGNVSPIESLAKILSCNINNIVIPQGTCMLCVKCSKHWRWRNSDKKYTLELHIRKVDDQILGAFKFYIPCDKINIECEMVP